jgi:hypothetical protein
MKGRVEMFSDKIPFILFFTYVSDIPKKKDSFFFLYFFQYCLGIISRLKIKFIKTRQKNKIKIRFIKINFKGNSQQTCGIFQKKILNSKQND